VYPFKSSVALLCALKKIFQGGKAMKVSIGQAAMTIGVSVTTLRRWEKSGQFRPDSRTLGGHRRYALESLKKLTNPNQVVEDTSKVAVAYARVSSSDQICDLETQSQKLAAFKKPGLHKLLNMMFLGQISHLVINHKDRLVRFGSELIFQYCHHFGVQVVILEESVPKNFEQELVSDVIQLMTVFSAKLYGRRSHQNRKKLAA
jgi:putative resolvase